LFGEAKRSTGTLCCSITMSPGRHQPIQASSDRASSKHGATIADTAAVPSDTETMMAPMPSVTAVNIKQPSDKTAVAPEGYSVFTVDQKRWIIVAGSFAAWFFPMRGSIYFPALNKIASDLEVSDSKISITVTTYLIIQGLAPMMIAGYSDNAGRRPAYFLCVGRSGFPLRLALLTRYTATSMTAGCADMLEED
jgi:hypothetical protein